MLAAWPIGWCPRSGSANRGSGAARQHTRRGAEAEDTGHAEARGQHAIGLVVATLFIRFRMLLALFTFTN
jgi:hypothetical protein